MIQKQLIISCCLLCFMASVQAQESVSSGSVITLQGTPLQMDEYTGTDFTTLILSRKIFFYDNTAMKEELYSPDGTVHTKIAYIYIPNKDCCQKSGGPMQPEHPNGNTHMSTMKKVN